MNRIVFRLSVLMVAIASLLSCGIPTIQFIGAPDRDSVELTPSPPLVAFAHNSDDNSTENFLGYEIYYKFYAYTADPLDQQFGTDLDAIDAAAPGSGIATVEARGFLRIWEPWDAGEDPMLSPLIAIDPSESATDFDIALVFPDNISALQPDPASADYLGRTTELIRDPYAWPVLTQRAFDSDSVQTEPNDPDVPPAIPPTDTVIHLGLIVLAYGIDFTGGTLGSLYSDPVMIDQPLEIILQ